MGQVNRHHQELLELSRIYGLDLQILRKKYTLLFVIKLFKFVLKGSSNKRKEVGMIFPNKNFNYKNDFDEYIKLLKDSGFNLKMTVEDFIDEDTGEIVAIKRYKLRPFKLIK